jgi:hypothetical protein
MEVGGQRHAPAALPAGMNPALILREADSAPRTVWQITNRQEHQTRTDDIHMRPHTA